MSCVPGQHRRSRGGSGGFFESVESSWEEGDESSWEERGEKGDVVERSRGKEEDESSWEKKRGLGRR